MNALRWAVMGFGGLVKMLVEETNVKHKIDECTLAEMEKYLGELKQVVDQQKKMIKEAE